MTSASRGRKSAPALALAAALIVGGSSTYLSSQDLRSPDDALPRVAQLSPEEKAAKAAAKAAKANKADKAEKADKDAKAGKKGAQPKQADVDASDADDGGGGKKKFQCPSGQIFDKRLKGCL